MSSVLRSRVAVLLTTVSAVLGGAVVLPAPAMAAPHYQSPPSVQVGYTDKATPRTAYDHTPEHDLPLGAWQDEAGAKHVSRVYATFDVSQFAGRPVIGGTIYVQEHTAADCTKRAIEVWQTAPVSATPSWANAPRRIRKLDEITTVGFCPGYLSFDVSAAIQAAAAHHRSRVTFEIRVPAQHERDVSYGRQLYWYAGVGLTVEYNNPPAIDPTARFNGGFPCAESAPYPALGSFAETLQAMATDADPDDRWRMRYEFAVWPADDPAARTVLTYNGETGRVSTVQIPAGLLVDGRTLSWQVRVGDGVDTSPWSGACSFVVDKTRPLAPQVTSANYPPANVGQGPLGEMGVFTFTATDPDTIGFQYAWETFPVPGCEYGPIGQLVCEDPFASANTVRADAPGGSATVRLNAPRSARNRLLVSSIDRAGWRSTRTVYDIFAAFGGEPEITVVGAEPEWGEQVTLRFSPYPGITGTVDYTYEINNGPEQTIAAAADGTATVSFTASNEYGASVTVHSRSANGWRSPEASWSVPFFPWPTVRSDIYVGSGEPVGGVGVVGTFTFSPPAGWTEVGGYQYSFNGADPVFVAAGPDRTATITWAPEASGYTYLEVFALRPDGTLSDYSRTLSFEVA